MSEDKKDKSTLSERDICSKFVTPALVAAGWDLQSQIREEVTFTAGRVIVRGSKVTRGEARRADFVLYYKPGIPIAVIEAKDNSHSVGAGMQQAHTVEEFRTERERDWWCKDTAAGRAHRKETPLALQVTLDEIKARNCALDIKNPNPEAAKHGDSEELLADYRNLLTGVDAARDPLRNELAKALESVQ
jgi:hypothetical protein